MALAAEAAEATAEVSRPDTAASVAGAAASAKPVALAATPASTVEEKVVDAAVAEAAVLAAVSVSGGTPSSTPSWLAVTGLAGAVAMRRVDVRAKARRRVGVSSRAALIGAGQLRVPRRWRPRGTWRGVAYSSES